MQNAQGDQLKVEEFKGSMKTSSINFRVEKCHDASHCLPQDQINAYLRNLDIEMWSIHEEIEFKKQGTRPTTLRMQIHDKMG